MMSPLIVDKMSDEELFKELKRRGYPAGPVVASTRKLYKRKLLEILGQEQGTNNYEQDEEEEEEEEEEDVEEELTSHEVEDKKWSQMSTRQVQEPRSSLGSRLSYGWNETSPTSKSFLSSSIYTDKDRDDLRAHSYVRESRETTRLSNPSWIPSRETSGSAVFRKTYSDTATARTEVPSRYSGSFDEFNYGRLSRRSISQRPNSNLRMILCAGFIVAALVMLCFIYNAWSDNDPYRQIEEDAKRVIEEYGKNIID